MNHLMKNVLFTSVLCFGLSLSANAADPQSVSVKFHGKIVDTTCTLGASTETVELGTYPVGYFTSINSKTEAKRFQLQISQCQLTTDETYEDGKFPVSRVYLTFKDDGTQPADGRVNGLLNPYGSTGDGSAAENVAVQVQFQKADGEYKNVFDTEDTETYKVSDMNIEDNGGQGTAAVSSIPMQAMMSPTNETSMPTAGDVNAQMTVTLTYQ